MSDDNARVRLLTGGCQCGEVRYALYAPPIKSGVCHCRMCQKATGSPFAALAESPADEFAWTRGTPATWQSSNRAARDFCGDCGTPLTFRPLDKPIVEVMVCTLDKPDAAPPTYEVGREGKLAWVAQVAALPGRTTLENIGAEKLGAIVSLQHPDHDT
jgi:hypothetical protein